MAVVLGAVIVLSCLAVPAAAQDSDVAAIDLLGDRPVPCADLATDGYPLIGGGCVVLAPAERIDLTVRTLFGPLRFARCDIAFNLHIGPDARLWLQGMSIDGTGACGDILPCRPKVPEEKLHLAAKLPWKGAISRTSGDRLRAELDLCFDTCLGRFEGRTRFELLEERGDWKMRTAGSIAGTSGFELDGEWDLDATGVGLRSSAYVKRAASGAPGFDLR